MEQLVSVEKSSTEAQRYLNGTFSKEARALTVPTLNHLNQETLTFKILNLKSIQRPPLFFVLQKTFRLSLLTLTLSPLFVAVAFHRSWIESSLLILALFVALSGFQLGIHLLNDYRDHLSGVDRLNPYRGSRSIQQGWFAAYELRNWSFFYLTLSFALGVWLLWGKWELFLLAISICLLGLIEFSVSGIRQKILFIKEILAISTLGPLLFYFVAMYFGSRPDSTYYLISLYFGLLAGFYFLVSSWQSILEDEHSRRNTFFTRFGFDRSQSAIKFYCFMLFLYPLFFLAWKQDIRYLPWALALSLTIPWIYCLARNIDSPLSSRFKKLRRFVLLLHFVSALLLMGVGQT